MDIGKLQSGKPNVHLNRKAPVKKEEARPIEDKVSLDSGKSKNVKINLLHLNDVHGAIEPFYDPDVSRESLVGGLSNLQTVIKEERSKNPEGTLLVGAGDFTDGSLLSNASEGKAAAEAMKPMGFDAIGAGNHDFCWGTGNFTNIVEEMGAPLVAGNITKDGEVMKGAKPFIIKEVEGVKVGIIGLDTTSTQKQTDPEKLNGLKFEDPIKSLKKHLPEMKKQGADVLVVLSHQGFETDRKMARAFKDESLVIVGGHSHTAIKKGHREGKSIIVQADSLTRYLGNLELEWNPDTKEIVKSDAKLIPILDSKIERDPEVEKILQPYLKKIDRSGANEIMGEAAEDLSYAHHHYAAKLNQIQADSLLKYSDADFAISLASTLRRHVQKGPVTLRNLFDSLPFDEWSGVQVKTKGKNVLALLEEGLEDGERLMIPAGLRYEADISRPEGERLLSVTLPDGKPLDPEAEYSVAMNDYFANKDMFKDATEKKDIGFLQEKFFDYFEDNCPAGGWKDDPDNRLLIFETKKPIKRVNYKRQF